jgi:hypothetical protein
MIRIFRLMAAIAMLVAMFVAIFPSNMSADDTAQPVETASAIFGGGCFWCVESDFEKLPGVIEAESGYIGGQIENPTYEQVSGGASGHVEVARIHYDPSKISYAELLDYFWRHSRTAASSKQSTPRFHPPAPSIAPRNIIRTTTRRIRFATSFTARHAVATPA